MHVSDPRELEMPDVGIVGVIDAETGRQRYVHTGSAALRARPTPRPPRSGTRRSVARIAGSGAEILRLSTARDWLTDTVRFATRRRGLRAASGARVRVTATLVAAARPVRAGRRAHLDRTELTR